VVVDSKGSADYAIVLLPMAERTEHGRERHQQHQHDDDRPTAEAFHDQDHPREIYQDVDSGYTIYVGANGRTHIFTPDGRHHTSFRTTRRNRQQRVQAGRWIRRALEG
jgi:hypothetical protein